MKIALPIIIQGLVFQLQSMVDKAFLGKLDTNYLSAVGVAQFPFSSTVDSLMAICIGLTIIVATKSGSGKHKDIHEIVNASIAFNTFFSLLLFVNWFVFSDQIFLLMNVDRDLLQYCNEYVRILSFFLIPYGIDMSLQATLQGMGKTKPIMFIGLFKVTLNIILAWVLIFGKLGFPPMYVKGAALATAIANISGSLLLIAYFIVTKKLTVRIRVREILRFRWDLFKKVLRLGLPTSAEFLLWNISNLILISLLNKQSVQVVAVYTVTYAVEIFVYMIFNGIAKATMTLSANSIGSGNKKAMKNIMSCSIRYSMIFVSLFCMIFIVFPQPILALFSDDRALINMSVLYLIVRGITMFPKSLNVVLGGGIRAMGDVKWMLYTQIFGSIFVVAFSYILMSGFKMGVIAIYLTLFLDELLRAALNTTRFYRGKVFRKLPNLALNREKEIQTEE
jgi:putative MATE family efflux protein